MAGGKASNLVLAKLLAQVDMELTSLFGPDGYYRWGEQAFMRMAEGVVVFLVCSPLGEDAVLNVRSYLVRDVERPDPELGDYLARLNADQIFGAFSIDEDADVCFDYSVLGSAVTPEVIQLAIQVVAEAAARHTQPIIERWGGVTAPEKLRQELREAGELPSDDEPAPN